MPDDTPVEPFLRMLADLDASGAVAYVRDVAAQQGVDRTVTDVLAAAQREVGRRWASGEWGIGHEHAATSIVDTALAVLDAGPADPDAPRLALVCAEGEWHATPARMAALRFHDRGWRVDFLGGSLPAASLRNVLEDLRPAVVAVSCTLSRNLPGARRTIAAAHEAGVPAIAGGAALGSGARRALAIGADAWGDDFDELDRTARQWGHAPPTLRRGVTHHADEVQVLQRREDDLVARIYADLLPTLPADGSLVDLELAAADVRSFVQHLQAALDLGDPTILADLLGTPPLPHTSADEVGRLTRVGLAAAEEHLGDGTPAARRLVADLLERAATGPGASGG